MKLNKFLAVAVAATVLPLSVAHAEGPEAPVLDKPELVLDAQGNPVLDAQGNPVTRPSVTTAKGPSLVNEKPDYGEKLVAPEVLNKERVYLGEDGKLHPYEGVNGPGAVHDIKPYGKALVAPEVHTKPEFKLPAGTSSDDTFGPRKGQTPSKTRDGHRTLPRTSAVK